MKEQKFKLLLHKYFDGTLTDVEAEILNQFDEKLFEKGVVAFKHEKHRLKIQASIYRGIQKKQKYTNRQFWQIAVGFLLLVGLGTTMFHFPSSADQDIVVQITHTTAWGQQENIVLPDGSKVTLNVGSSISFPEQFDKSKRNVKLSGEAFFEVVKNKEAPFIIHTDEVTTTVLGTSFNINTKDKEHITVTVATGKVRVGTKNTTEVILTPKQQARYNIATQSISTKKVNLNQYLDWKEGVLQFENVTLDEAAKILERWYNVNIKVLNDDIANCRFSGKFNNETLPTVLESLANLKANMKYTILEKGKVQIKGTCN